MTPAEFKATRNVLCLSQNDLAEVWGMGDNGGRTIRKWENGERPLNPIAAYCIALMVNPDTKTQSEDDEPAPSVREAARVPERFHEEQVQIWSQEILEALAMHDLLKIDTYDAKIEAHRAISRELVDIGHALDTLCMGGSCRLPRYRRRER